MKKADILAVFHYIPLHTAPAGQCYGEFRGEDVYTTKESERLVRLPLYYNLTNDDQQKVICEIYRFFGKKYL
jgi:dTDP-4-amino-4,6-dideoxygalactose transaminase